MLDVKYLCCANRESMQNDKVAYLGSGHKCPFTPARCVGVSCHVFAVSDGKFRILHVIMFFCECYKKIYRVLLFAVRYSKKSMARHVNASPRCG